MNGLITQLESELGLEYTTEQLAFIDSLHEVPEYAYACPGSGKTELVCVAAAIHCLRDGVDPEKILLSSFNRNAVANLQQRFNKYTSVLHLLKTPVIRTIDSIAYEIVKNHYDVLHLSTPPDITVNDGMGEKAMFNTVIKEALDGVEIKYNIRDVRAIGRAIKDVNNMLIFNEEEIQKRSLFMDTGLSIESFVALRRYVYRLYLITGRFPLDMVPMIALTIVKRSEEVANIYKQQYELAFIDEFQDYNTTQNELIKCITGNIVIVGDPRQRIYGFRGANRYIIEHFKLSYPNYKVFQLTKSFRCPDNIAKLGNEVIAGAKLDKDLIPMVGNGTTGNISFRDDKRNVVDEQITKILEEISQGNYKTYHFLARNNRNLTYLINKLYSNKIVFTINNYQGVFNEVPLRPLVRLYNILLNPEARDDMNVLYFFAHDKVNYRDIHEANMKIVREYNGNFFDAPVLETSAMKQLFDTCAEVREQLTDITGTFEWSKFLYAFSEEYSATTIVPNSWRYDWDYTTILELLTESGYLNMSMRESFSNEREKVEFIANAQTMVRNIHIGTIHTVKGLEADTVCIIDANSDIFPSYERLARQIYKGYKGEAAETLREEFCILFVAVTRAKYNLIVTYDKTLTQLISGANPFPQIDHELENPIIVMSDVDRIEEALK